MFKMFRPFSAYCQNNSFQKRKWEQNMMSCCGWRWGLINNTVDRHFRITRKQSWTHTPRTDVYSGCSCVSPFYLVPIGASQQSWSQSTNTTVKPSARRSVNGTWRTSWSRLYIRHFSRTVAFVFRRMHIRNQDSAFLWSEQETVVVTVNYFVAKKIPVSPNTFTSLTVCVYYGIQLSPSL